MQGAAILLSLLAWSVPLDSYFRSYHDFPWPALAGTLLLLTVLGWRCGQRWLPVTLVVALAWWIRSVLSPTVLTLPASATLRGLTLTLQSVDSGRLVNFRLSPEADLKRLDLDHMRVRATVPPGLGVRAWQPHSLDEEESRLSCWVFPPFWSQVMDLDVSLPAWPDKAAVALTLPVPGAGRRGSPVAGEAEGMSLRVSDLRWTTQSVNDPEERCLALHLAYTGFSYSGSNGREVAAWSERGENIRLWSRSISSRGNETTVDAVLDPLPKGCRAVTLRLYSSAQRSAAEHRFRFRGVPNRTANMGPDEPFIAR